MKFDNSLNSNYPLVTVFTLIYNTNPKFVIEAIESVRANNYPNLQHIIIDDCSPDPEPKSVVKEWIKNEGYLCEFHEHEVNYGLCKTLNHVLQLAKGKYMFGCSDDVILCDRILGDINLFESNKLIDVVHSNYQIINALGELSSKGKEISIENKLYFDRLLVSNFISVPTVTWKVERLKKVGGFSEKFKFEDYELWLRMAKMGCLFKFRNEITTLYRVHELSFSQNRWREVFIEDLKIKIEYTDCYNQSEVNRLKHIFISQLKEEGLKKDILECYFLFKQKIGRSLFNLYFISKSYWIIRNKFMRYFFMAKKLVKDRLKMQLNKILYGQF